MFTEKDLVGLYFQWLDINGTLHLYKLIKADINTNIRCIGIDDEDASPGKYKDHLIPEVLRLLNNCDWQFVFHDDIVSKHPVIQELIESRDKDNINIVIEMYKTLKHEEETTIINSNDYSH